MSRFQVRSKTRDISGWGDWSKWREPSADPENMAKWLREWAKEWPTPCASVTITFVSTKHQWRLK
jgi:hypothetical protein